jgi:phage terminase large subunit-like protein
MAAPPLFLTPVPYEDMVRGDGEQTIDFTQSFCRITKESIGGRAGDLITMRDWQKTLSHAIYARRPDNRFRHRRALIGVPRKNGKSAIGSSFGLKGLVLSPPGSEVYSCAADKDQAKLVFNVAKEMVKLDPDLSGMIKPYRDVLEFQHPDGSPSIYKALSSETLTKEGLNPTTVLFDELHAQENDELYDVMSNAFGARRDPLLIMITTAGLRQYHEEDSLCYRMYEYGKRLVSGEEIDPTFFFAWWGTEDADVDPSDPAIWEATNPGYGDLIDPEDFVSVYKQALAKGTVNDFKTKRLNMWVTAKNAWLPQGAWDERAAKGTCEGQSIVVGFDGARDGTSASIIRVSVGENPRVEVAGHWERPVDMAKDQDWQVPREEIKEALRNECRNYDVAEIAWQEFFWPSDAEQLTDEGLPIVVFNQTLTRMGPATQRMYELVTTGQLSNDGNPALSRHVANAVTKTDSRGTRLVRTNGSIAAIAATMAVDRAGFWATAPDRPGYFKGRKVSEIRFVW